MIRGNRSLRLILVVWCYLGTPSLATPPPDVEDLLQFAIYWNQSDVGAKHSNFFAQDLLCLLAGECDLFAPCPCDEPVTFADADFEALIRTTLGKPEGTICRCDMAQIRRITNGLFSGTNPNCPGNISSIDGIQHAINLESLELGCGFISDLSPLSGLSKLRTLKFHDNYIANLSPLAPLTNLETLDLFSNNGLLTEISALSGMTHLKEVNLSDNDISDISALAGNTGMRNLDLQGNSIVDLSPLANMTQIAELYLSDNKIVDLGPLAGMTGTTHLELHENEILEVGPLQEMAELTYLNLSDNEISGIQALAGKTQLVSLFLKNNMIDDIAPLALLVKVVELDLENNLIPDLSPLSGMTGLTSLSAKTNRVSDLAPLSTLVNLGLINLSDNRLTSLESLPNLPELAFLFLSKNQIDALPAFALERVPNLVSLQLNENQITDLSAIAVLPALESFQVTMNGIDDAALASLPVYATLENLAIGSNPISDLSPVQRFPNLKNLSAGGSMVSDLSPLASMTQLEVLFLTDNLISDLSPLQGLVHLTNLLLDSNTVSDLTPVAALVGLRDLQIRSNLIMDLQPLIDNPDFGNSSMAIFLSGNPLTFTAQCQQLPILAARGISIFFPGGFDCHTPTPTQDPSLPTSTPTETRTPTSTRTPTPTPTQGGDALVWAGGVNPSGSVSAGKDVVALEDGTSFQTGYFQGAATFGMGEPSETTLVSVNGNFGASVDAYVARSNSDGSLVWAKRAGAGEDDRGNGIDALPDGTTLVTGHYQGGAVFGHGEPGETTLEGIGGLDIFVSKFNPDGTLAWVRKAGGTGSDESNGVSAHSDGGCVISGSFIGSATFGAGEPGQTVLNSSGGRDIFLARYNSDGSLAWAKQAGSTDQDEGNGVSIAESVGILVTGDFRGTATFGMGEAGATDLVAFNQYDIFVAMYHLDGTLAWAKKAGRGSFDFGQRIDSFEDGSSIVTGSFGSFGLFGPGEPGEVELMTTGLSDIFVAKYGPDGILQWAKQAGGDGDDFGYGVSLLPNGSLFVAGQFDSSATFGPGEANETHLVAAGPSEEPTDMFIAKYNSDGTLAWAAKAGGLLSDVASGVHAVPPGDAIVVGSYRSEAVFGSGESGEITLPYTNTVSGSAIFTARYSP